MRILGSSVLAIEAIVILLATALAASNGSANPSVAWPVGLLLMLLLFLAPGTLGKSYGVWVGWILQVLVVATAFVVPGMWIIGGVFAGLWFMAVRNGKRIDDLKAQRTA